jgi:hypothetical protein
VGRFVEQRTVGVEQERPDRRVEGASMSLLRMDEPRMT